MRSSLVLCLVAVVAVFLLSETHAQISNYVGGGGANSVGGSNPGNCKTDCPPRKPGEPLLCGTDGTRRILFNNYCTMQMHNCLYGKKFRYYRRGSCY